VLDNLEVLEITDSTIYDLSDISQMENLRSLNMQFVLINSIKDVVNLKNLEYMTIGSSNITGNFLEENFAISLFDSLDNIKYVRLFIGNCDVACAQYQIGNQTDSKYSLPSNWYDIPHGGIEKPIYFRYSINKYNYDFYEQDLANLNKIEDYEGYQYLAILVDPPNSDELIKITIPKNIRYLFLFSESDIPLKIELDGQDNPALESILVGNYEIDEARGNPQWDGDGSNLFILENLDGLEGCTNLKEVRIQSAGISDISGLADSEKLEVVELPGNEINEISVLADKPI
jgi:hypothetical protein